MRHASFARERAASSPSSEIARRTAHNRRHEFSRRQGAEQLREYNAGLHQLDGLGAQVLALSPQDVDSHERFRAEHGFQFPLLADTDKAVGQAYGIIGPLGFYRRSIFVVNATMYSVPTAA